MKRNLCDIGGQYVKIKASKKDIIWNYIGVIMSMASNFFLLPFMMYFVESDSLGLWYVYLSIGAIVTLFDFGFNPTFARNIAYCWSGAKSLNAEGVEYVTNSLPNYELLSKVIDTCKRIYLLLAFAALLVLLTVGSVYIYYVSNEIFGEEVVVSWLIYAMAVFLNLYYGYYATFLRGIGAISNYNKINVLARIIQICVAIFLMVLGYGIVAVALAYLLYGYLLRFFSKRVFYKYNGLGEKISYMPRASNRETKEVFLTVWHNAWRDGVVALANYLANQASTLIASFFLTLTETGTYSISVQLITAIATIAAALYTSYQPALQSAYINEDKKESERLMGTAMTVYTYIFIIGTLALLTVGIPILRTVKPTTIFNRSVITGIAIYNFFYKGQSYFASFISNTNHVPYMNAYIVSGFSGILLSIILMSVFNLGVWGLILGQFLPQLIYNCWKWPREVFMMLSSSALKMACVGNNNLLKALRVKR
jgi:O-antigen/teichoic acid export membrane protein